MELEELNIEREVEIEVERGSRVLEMVLFVNQEALDSVLGFGIGYIENSPELVGSCQLRHGLS